MVDMVMTDLPRIPLYTRFADYAMQKDVHGFRILVPRPPRLPQAVQGVMPKESALVATRFDHSSSKATRMTDPLGAFVPGVDVRLPGRAGGPLDGLTFAAKDLFDVQGFVTGCGNPDWAATHTAAERSAAAVEALLNAGASLVGKTITDEISLGLLGINRLLRHAAQSARARPRPRRLVERLRFGRGGRRLRHCARNRFRGVGARARELLRPVRASSDSGPDRCAGHDGPVPDIRHRGLFHPRRRDLRQGRRGSAGRTHRSRATRGDHRRDRCLRARGRGRARRAGPRCRSVSTRSRT